MSLVSDIPNPQDFWWDSKRHVELPMGVFMAQPVGSTSYCNGLHITVHLAGEDERVRGVLSFKARLERDGTVTWLRQQQSTYTIKHERADEILEAAFGVARSWFERDPQHCVIYYLDLTVEETRRWRHLMRQESDSLEHMTKLLADPGAPRTRNQKNDEGEWEEVQVTEDEWAASRALWERNHQRATDKLTALHAEQGARIAQLRSIENRCRAFLKDNTAPLLPFEAVGPTFIQEVSP